MFLYFNYTISYSGLLAFSKHVLYFSETTMPLLLNWETEGLVIFDNIAQVLCSDFNGLKTRQPFQINCWKYKKTLT